MGKAKWWICGSCRSLNDLPANKCYKCREPKGSDPELLDDQYGQVGGGQQRVGVTVDLSQVGNLTSPDPVETQEGGGIIERFERDMRDDIYADVDSRSPTPAADQSAALPPPAGPPGAPPPLREPERRGITAAGGRRLTGELLDELPPRSPAQTPPSPDSPAEAPPHERGPA